MLLPANDAYVVALPDEKELLVPALKQIIEGFDAGKKELRLRVDKAYLGYED
jgi:ribosomal 30S subunit maturation factor RimM